MRSWDVGPLPTAAEARLAREAGAHFLVAPLLSREVTRATDLPTMLAGFTPTELNEAAQMTSWLVKLFPSASAGADYIRAVLAVFPRMPIVATGGIVPDNAHEFLAASATAVASSYPGPVDGRLDPSATAAGVRRLRESIERRGAAGDP